ncbi:MAG: ATP-binding protein [Myxococcota bacterium]
MRLLGPGAFSLFRTRVARRMILALILAAILPLIAALGVAFALLEFSIGVGINQTVQEALDDDLPLYGALFDAKKSEYRAAARMLAQRITEHPDVELNTLLREHPELGRLTIEKTPAQPKKPVDDEEEVRGDVVQSIQPESVPPGRPFAVVVPLDEKRVLRAEFHLPPRFDSGLARARELAESYAAISRARGAITRGLLLTFLAIMLFVLLGAAVLAGLIARSITRKVALLADATRAAASGNLGVRVEEHWQDELGDLARAFNRMLAEIAESRDRIVYLEKISGWQEVARRLAHEIKNPLTPIVLAVQEIAEKVPQEPASFARLVKTAREVVEEEASTLRRLVQEFSEFARLPDVRTEPTELVAFVREYHDVARDVHAVAELTVETQDSTLWTLLDRALFRRVLQNLVENGVEAQGMRLGPNAGAISTPPMRRPKVVVRLSRAPGGWIALDVHDAGPGVPPEDRVRIFEPYITSKAHGTGLGLAIVKKIVLQHGGTIGVTRSPEGGACFQVRLPVLDSPPILQT